MCTVSKSHILDQTNFRWNSNCSVTPREKLAYFMQSVREGMDAQLLSLGIITSDDGLMTHMTYRVAMGYSTCSYQVV